MYVILFYHITDILLCVSCSRLYRDSIYNQDRWY